MSKTIGMLGGKFYPVPHQGHVFAMTVASTMVDELHVIVSYDENFEKETLSKDSKTPHIDYRQRVRWWKQITKDMPHVKVHAVEETNDGTFESWKKGAEGIHEAIGKPITHVFSSEKSYTGFFSKLYPGVAHYIIDASRHKYPISGTKIRKEGIMKNWDMLPEVVRRHFVRRVVIVGEESTGKSTLVKNLATLYDTNYVEEHGRTFYEEMNSYETFEEDFSKIAYRQKYFEEEGLKHANRLLFIDTEALTTMRFLHMYHGQTKETRMLVGIGKIQQYDLVLFLESDVKWVDDGTRIYKNQEERIEGSNSLKELLTQFGVRYETITGDYRVRLGESTRHIDNLIQEG